MLQEQVICYCSSFDLDSSEWLLLSENVEQLMWTMHECLGKLFLFFSLHLSFSSIFTHPFLLGKMWHIWFADVVKKQNDKDSAESELNGGFVH